MQKAAPLIIFKWIHFSGRTRSSRHHEAFLSNQNGKVMPIWVCLVHQEAFLSKH